MLWFVWCYTILCCITWKVRYGMVWCGVAGYFTVLCDIILLHYTYVGEFYNLDMMVWYDII